MANRFLITTHPFLWDCGSRLAQTRCGDRQRVGEIGPNSCDASALGGRGLRLFQLQCRAILGDSFVKSRQPAISEAKEIVNIGQFRLQFRCATGMISSLRIPFLIEASLRNLDVSLPSIGVFGEIVLPKILFIAINFRPAKGVCAHCANQQRDRGGGGDFLCAWSLPPYVGDASAEQREQGNIRKILEMIRDERAAAYVSHSDESNCWQ